MRPVVYQHPLAYLLGIEASAASCWSWAEKSHVKAVSYTSISTACTLTTTTRVGVGMSRVLTLENADAPA